MKQKLQFIPILLCMSFFSCESKKKESGLMETDPYEQHVELRWNPSDSASSYSVWVSVDGEDFTKRGETTDTLYLDFVKDLGTDLQLSYEIRANHQQDTVDWLRKKQLPGKCLKMNFWTWWNTIPSGTSGMERNPIPGWHRSGFTSTRIIRTTMPISSRQAELVSDFSV